MNAIAGRPQSADRDVAIESGRDPSRSSAIATMLDREQSRQLRLYPVAELERWIREQSWRSDSAA